jgi:hypothetical protein
MPSEDVRVQRARALDLAVALWEGEAFGAETDRADPDTATQDMLATATAIYRWLTGPVAFVITIGPVLSQSTGEPTGRTMGGTPMQLHDDEQVALSVGVFDAKGAEITDDPATTNDDLVWSFDNPDVATLEVSADTRTCTVVAGLPGSGTGTVVLGAVAASFAVDVVPAGAATITITEGVPEPQPTV